MNICELSSKYNVRKMTSGDVKTIYELSLGNPLFYHFCPPEVTPERILNDMTILPPQMTYEDKYYMGFFEEDKLIAVMDIVLGYPNVQTAFIGMFMMCKSEQGKGIGSGIVEECAEFLKKQGYRYIRLAIAKGNPQSEYFWKKNGFVSTGIEKEKEAYTAILMERNI